MLKKNDILNKEIKSFINFACREISLLEPILVVNGNISYLPTHNENRVEFKITNILSTGRILEIREKISLDTDILTTNDMDMKCDIKIRVISYPEQTLDIVDKIALHLNSFTVVNSLMPSINILNEETRFSCIEVENGEQTYYIYDITIPSVISERVAVRAIELTGVFTSVNGVIVEIKEE